MARESPNAIVFLERPLSVTPRFFNLTNCSQRRGEPFPPRAGCVFRAAPDAAPQHGARQCLQQRDRPQRCRALMRAGFRRGWTGSGFSIAVFNRQWASASWRTMRAPSPSTPSKQRPPSSLTRFSTWFSPPFRQRLRRQWFDTRNNCSWFGMHSKISKRVVKWCK